MPEKIALIKSIFASIITEDGENNSQGNTPLQNGKYYGGIYNGRKYMYSQVMIETMPIEKLKAFILKQIGHE